MLYYIIGTGSKYGWSGRGWISFSADLPNMVQFMLVLCVLQVINGNCYVVTCFKFEKRIPRLSVSPHILHFCIGMFSMKARFQVVPECFHHFFIKSVVGGQLSLQATPRFYLTALEKNRFSMAAG